MKTILVPVILCCALVACKSSEERAEDYFQSGQELVQSGDVDRAVVEFRNALQINDTHVEARRTIGKIELERGNTPRAYSAFLRLAEQNPDDAESRIVLSELAFLSASWDEFTRHSDRAIKLAADEPRVQAIEMAARYRTAVMEQKQKERFEILAEAEDLRTTLPDNAMLRQILIDGYVGQQKYEPAIEQLEKAIASDPDNLQFYGSKLELLNRLGDIEGVEAEMRRMVTLFPDNQNIKQTLLRYLIAQDKSDAAETFLRELVAEAPEDERDKALVSLVQFLLQTKGDDAALAELEKEIEVNPNAGLLKALRASMFFDAGDRDKGISELQTLLTDETVTLGPSDRQNVKVTLAKMLQTQGNEVGARKQVEEVLAEDPNAVAALKMQASWLIRDDKTDEAINVLRTALDQAPEDVEAMGLMAEAYQRSGDNNLMRDFLSLAVENSNNAPAQSIRYARALIQNDNALQAETVLINSLRVTANNVDVLQLLGQVYLQIEDLPRATQVVEALRNIETDAASLAASGLNVELLAREAGPERALEFLNTLAGQEGDKASAAKLALLRNKLTSGETAEALDYAKELVAEDGNNLAFRNALALTYSANRDFAAAQAELRSMLDENNQLVPVWLELSRVTLVTNDRPAALAVLKEGLAVVPDSPDLLWGQASFLQQDGDIEGAISIYEGLYDRFSSSTVIANNLASLLSAYRSDEDSLTRAQTISRRLKDSDVPAFQDTYGWIEHLNGNSQEAVSYLEPAAAGMPNDPSVQVHLGLVYAALGRTEEALTQLRKAVEQAGILNEDPIIQSARDKITELEAL